MRREDALFAGSLAFIAIVAGVNAALGLPAQKDGFGYFVDSFRNK